MNCKYLLAFCVITVGATCTCGTVTAAAPPSGVSDLSNVGWISATNGWGPVEKNMSNGEQAQGDGHKISIRGVTFTNGLGVHAPSDVRYTLSSACSTFSANIGVDDEVAPNGSVIFQVYGDGVKLYDSGLVTGAMAAKGITVNVAGKNELRLVVTDGGNGISNDHADWATARITCGVSTTYVSAMTAVFESNGWGPVEHDSSNGEKAQNDGHTISIRGVTFNKGLGVHANSTVRYNLGGACYTFAASVGVDDEVAPTGSVVFQVWGNGVKLYDSGVVTGSMPAKSVSVDVSGKSQMDLIVTDGGDGASNDHGDWAMARLTCTQSTAVASVNQAPRVNAGSNQSIILPATAQLSGSAIDDGLPSNTLTVRWTVAGGPGQVSFANATSAVTTASFTTAGVYTLRLSAFDGALTSTNDTTITVQPSLAPAGSVIINPGDNLRDKVAANPAGTTFFIRAGVHRLQSVEPKDGDVFIGEPGAILNGAALLTNFVREGVYWVATGQFQQGARGGSCLPDAPRCDYPEVLFFDNRPLKHVGNLSQVGPGNYFFDYSAHKIYFADDPNGHVIETSVAPQAFYGPEADVRIEGLIIEKYACPGTGTAWSEPTAAIHALTVGSGPWSKRWIIKNNEVRLNHGAGIRATEGAQIVGNNVHTNGQFGINAGGTGVLVENNEIAYNNYAGFDWSWGAGGTKFAFTDGLILRGNFAHHNIGPGLWTDIDNVNTLIENNRTTANIAAGILHEISFRATIRNNTVESDGFRPDQYDGWGIVAADSSDVEIYGNTVLNCMNGIGGTQANRGSSSSGQPYRLQNLYVHDNTLTQATGHAAGLIGWVDNSVYSQNNRFNVNTYRLSNNDSKFYIWMDTDIGRQQWQSYGNDLSGQWQ